MEGELKTIETRKGKPCLLYNDFRYRFHRDGKEKSKSWRCCKTSCTGKLVTDSECKIVITEGGVHNHQPDLHDNQVQELRSSVKRKALDDISTRPSKIVKKSLLSQNNTEDVTPKDVQSVCRSIYSKRRQKYPVLPKSREDTQKTLADLDIKTHTGEDFLKYNDPSNGFLIFTCDRNLQFLSEVTEVVMDGTFKSCPPFFYQVYIIHGVSNGHYIPLVYILLPGKTESLYKQAFSALFQALADSGLQFQPQVILVDFELSVINALRELVPEIPVKCCRFHLGQSIYRKIQSLGLSTMYQDSTDDVSKWLHPWFGLSFLHPTQVEESFAFDLMADIPSDEKCEQFADFMLKTYIAASATFPPRLWADVPSTMKRTTNGAESFHAHLNVQFSSKHPNIFIFLEALQQSQAMAYMRMNHKNVTTRAETKKQIERMKQTQELYNRLQNGDMSRLNYLRAIAYKFPVHI